MMSFSFSKAADTISGLPGFPGSDHDLPGDGSDAPPNAQQILDALGAHIAVLDACGRIIAVNRVWNQFAEENGGRLEGIGVGIDYLKVCDQAAGENSDEAAAAGTGIKAVLDGRLSEFRLEYPCHSPAEKRWFLLHASPLRGPRRGVVTAHFDITDRKSAELAQERAAAALAQSNDRLTRLGAEREDLAASRQRAYRDLEIAYQELKATQSQLVQAEKLSALGQLVAGVAHEINNPLAFVTNNLTLLHREFLGLAELVVLYETARPILADHDPALLAIIQEVSERIDLGFLIPGLEDLIDRTANGLRRIVQIVAGLRNFARLDEAELKEADINEGVAATITILGLKARECGVRLDAELTPIPHLTCYPGQINQVVLNLVANAIDASSPGDRVTVGTVANPAGVEIRVIDQGQGIDPSLLNRIFDPFFTTKPVGKGTGLGLSIGYGIVVSHGGQIQVESTPGQGSRFTVFLPFRSPLTGS